MSPQGHRRTDEHEMQKWARDSVYPPHIIDVPVSIKIKSSDQILALAPYIDEIIAKTAIEFAECREGYLSTTAIDCAVVNTFMNQMMKQLQDAWAESHQGERPHWLMTYDQKKNAGPPAASAR